MGKSIGEVTDKEILDGCLKGKRKYQELLYRQYYAFGMSVSLRYLPSREEALEVLNDSFLKVFQNLETFDLEKPFKTWFRRILINTTIDSYRKNSRAVLKNELSDMETEIAIEPDYVKEMNGQEILTLFDSLPVQHRLVFNLYEIEGYNHEEIGGMLDVSPGTSRSSLSRAKKTIKELYFKMINQNCHEAV